MRRATHDLLVVGQINQISIHALREESDATTGSIAGWKMEFQSTLSVRRATIVNNITIIYILFQSTLSVRRATFMWVVIFPLAFTISIHALREESDDTYLLVTNECMNFNPRSPWGERLNIMANCPLKKGFQSTLSVRRATANWVQYRDFLLISIHALREESDDAITKLFNSNGLFQSTLSVRRATLQKSRLDNLLFDFNPRSPWGERLCWAISKSITSLFQSTLSVRRATQSSYCYWRPKSHFNPRSPWGERRKIWWY